MELKPIMFLHKGGITLSNQTPGEWYGNMMDVSHYLV